MLKMFSAEAYEFSCMPHREMFNKLNSMTTEELNNFRAKSTYAHMLFFKEQAERAAYVDTTLITILRLRATETPEEDL